MDEEGQAPIIGLVHKECLRPIDRVLGKIDSELFDKHPFLKEFDVNTWARLIVHGQGFFKFTEYSQIHQGKVVHMGWSPSGELDATYNYCNRMLLADGSFQYVSHRGNVEAPKSSKGPSGMGDL